MKTVLAAALLLTLGLASQQANAAGPVPRNMGEFTMATPAGAKISISSYKGKVMVVQFLSVTCPHCQKFSQTLTKLMGDPDLKGFQPLGCAFDEGIKPENVNSYVSTYKVGMPVGYSDRTKVLGYLGISVMERIGVPQIVIIDKKGQIRAQTDSDGGGKLSDEIYLKAYITSLLKEGSAGPASKATPAAKAKAPKVKDGD
ncbi:MAG: TlpA disulfide reductase family protein [Acidobacteriota bacterium]